MMVPEIFADSIGEISVANGVIRLDLVSLSATGKDEKGQPVRELRQRIIMSPQGFIEAFGAMENVMHKLVELGVIAKHPPASPAPSMDESRVHPASPNFS